MSYTWQGGGWGIRTHPSVGIELPAELPFSKSVSLLRKTFLVGFLGYNVGVFYNFFSPNLFQALLLFAISHSHLVNLINVNLTEWFPFT